MPGIWRNSLFVVKKYGQIMGSYSFKIDGREANVKYVFMGAS